MIVKLELDTGGYRDTFILVAPTKQVAKQLVVDRFIDRWFDETDHEEYTIIGIAEDNTPRVLMGEFDRKL